MNLKLRVYKKKTNSDALGTNENRSTPFLEAAGENVVAGKTTDIHEEST